MKNNEKSNEFDIILAMKQILRRKYLLVSFLTVSSVLGIVIALNSPKEYTAESILAPEIQSTGLSGSLSDMAANFGLDLDTKQSVDAIYPELYPIVVGSNDFIRNLFDIKVRTTKSDSVTTYFNHLKYQTKVPFWQTWKLKLIHALIKKNDTANLVGNVDKFQMPKKEFETCEGIRNNIACLVDNKTSIITITCTDQDPLVAAILVDTVQNRLQEYINKYKTKKNKNDVFYYNKLKNEALNNYKTAQKKYAKFADANIDLSLQSLQSKQEELENDMQLKYNTYTQMTAQYQASLAKLQESTPAYTILQRPIMPYKASSTPRFVIVLLFVTIGFFLDAVWVLLISPNRRRLENNQEQDKSEDKNQEE